MGPMNEYERRFLDQTQQYLWLRDANIGGPAPEHFGYPLIFGSAATALANGVLAQGVISMQADAWFLWTQLSLMVTIPTTAGFGGPEQMTDGGNLLLQIYVTGTGDDLYNVPAGFAGMPAALSSGSPTAASAGIPYIFPTPVLLPPNSNVNVTVQKYGTNVGADNPDMTGAYLALTGTRIMVWQ